MALEPAIVLGTDDLGVTGLICTRPGFSALSTPASDVAKLTFHSSWDRVEKVHQIGSVSPASFGYSMAQVSFPELPYRPIVTVRRRYGDEIRGDEWFTSSSAADDPYISYFLVQSWFDSFRIHASVFAFTNDEDFPPYDGDSFVFDYIVWRLGADQLT